MLEEKKKERLGVQLWIWKQVLVLQFVSSVDSTVLFLPES